MEILSAGIVLLYDNADPHTTASTRELLDQFGWKMSDYPAYNPELVPSDYHLFLTLKEFLGGKHFGRDEELENAVITWRNELAAKEQGNSVARVEVKTDV